MNVKLQLTLLVIAIITTLIILRAIHNSKIEIKYSVIWIIWSLGIFVLILYPNALDKLSSFLGIATPTNALFMISSFLTYVMIFYLYKKISIHLESIKNLNYEIAKLKKEMMDLKEKKEDKDE